MSNQTKYYIFGKLLDPEIITSSCSGKSFCKFCIYSHHDTVAFMEPEYRSYSRDGQVVEEPNPRFKVLSELKQGDFVMCQVNVVFNPETRVPRLFLNDIYAVSPSQAQTVNDIISRKSDESEAPASGFKLKRS